jgi:hypothetical protein
MLQELIEQRPKWCEVTDEPVVVNTSLPAKAGDSLEEKTATTSSKESAVTESSLDEFTQAKSLRELRMGEVRVKERKSLSQEKQSIRRELRPDQERRERSER